MIRLMAPIVVLALLVSTPLSAKADSRFGTVMKKKYNLRTISCYACHVKDEEKDVLNSFGLEIHKLIEGKELSAKLEAAKGVEFEERKKVYEEVEKEFLAALKKLDMKKAPSGKTYAEAIPAGEIEGTRPRR